MHLEETKRGSGSSRKTKKRTYRRHSAEKVASLDKMFRLCPHPDEDRRRKMGEELGLDSIQIKFWFQNKRTQLKTLMGRSHNNALRLENQRIQQENLLLKETLKKVVCVSCGGRHFADQKESEQCLQKLRMENFLLTQQYEKVSKFLSDNNIVTNPMHLGGPSSSSSHNNNTALQNLQNQTGSGIPDPHQYIPNIINQNNIPARDQHIPVIAHDQHIPVIAHDQHIPVIAHDQHIPVISHDQHIPVIAHDQHIPVIAHDQHIPVIAHDQHIPVISHDQHIPVISHDQHIPVIAHDQHIPIIAQDQHIPIIAQDQHIPIIAQDQYIPIIAQDQHIPILAQDQYIPIIAQDQHIPIIAQDQHIPIAHNHQLIPVAPSQHIPAAPSQHIPDAPSQHIPVVNQNIPTPTPTLDQGIYVVDPGFNQNAPAPILDDYYMPTLNNPPVSQNIPPLDQDFPPLISSLDHNVPALVTALDQNIPSLIPHHDQHNNNNPVVEKIIGQPKLGLIPAAVTPSALRQNTVPSLDLDLDAVLRSINNDDKSLTEEISNTAMQELMKLLTTNEPFWFRSLVNGKFVLHRESYRRIFRRNSYLKGTHARLEASKDSQIVRMSGPQLVEMFLKADKWADLFPTIIKKAQTIQVFDSASSGSGNGALQLMKAEMHILSPLVPTREFLFIRTCKQIKAGVWVIGDVSFESSKYTTTTSLAWRLPSGCLIQEMAPEGRLCKVSWVEHVQVDDKFQTHRLYRELICGNNAYGAERWVSTLERMCERFASASAQTMPISDIGGVIRSVEGRRSVMDLSHRMVKVYCGCLDMRDNIDFPHLTRIANGEVRVCVRNNTDQQEMPKGVIISVAASFWLPLSPHTVFGFLKDNKRRAEWDVLCYGNPVQVMQHISNGINPSNCTSIIRPSIPNGNSTLILQESYIDASGYMLVYAPFDMRSINLAIKGEDSSDVPVLSSGFTISCDGESHAVEGQVGKSGGSLVTLANQILVSDQSSKGQLDLQSVGVVNTIVTSTVEKIKIALKC